jgi:uncharacterized protein (DUF58 family)
MLTPRGLALCIIAVMAWGLGRLLGVDELYVVSAASAAMIVLAVASTRLSSTRVAVRRITGTVHTRQQEKVPIELQLRNDGRLPASLLLVEDRRPTSVSAADDDHGAARFVVRSLRPRQVVKLDWKAIGRRRGRYTIGPVRIRLRDPFGLAERTRRYRSTDDLVVFPAVESLATKGTRGARQGAETSALRRAFHRGDEFYTMRTYVVGDDLRHVHWPSTAHRGTLMVRQHELPWNAKAVIYLDTRGAVHRGSGPRGSFERAVSAAASVLLHLRDNGYDVQLETGDDEAHHSTGGSADAALVRLAEVSPAVSTSVSNAMARLARAGNGLFVAVVRPPAENAEFLGRGPAEAPARVSRDAKLTEHPEVRALLRAGHDYRACMALVIERHDQERCATFARMLQLAGWRSAVVAQGEPLVDAWQRAVIGVAVAEPEDLAEVGGVDHG